MRMEGKGRACKKKRLKKTTQKKGKIRLQLEEMAKQANVRMFIAHFPDFMVQMQKAHLFIIH